ncbi:il21r [Pungitius sinensis]
MAVRAGLLLLLWDLALFPPGVASSCNVTCSTDYKTSLNCSCSDSTFSGFIVASCSLDEVTVNGSCEVKPPQPWCVMYPETLDDVLDVFTTCTATAGPRRDQRATGPSGAWSLCNVVKPSPPVDVRVTNTGRWYNISWDHDGRHCLTYELRVREDGGPSKNPLYVNEKKFVLDHKQLQPRVSYVVDVRAKMCPEHQYFGPWSEWSSAARWKTGGALEELDGLWWYVTLSVTLVLVLLLLGYFKKTWWQQKLQRILYIPKAEKFFQPLHLAYGGDFKEWVKPVFSEHDYLRIDPHGQATSEKQRGLLQWSNEKRCCGEDPGAADPLRPPRPHSNPLLFFQGSQDISIHTVTLSGEEELEGVRGGRAGGDLEGPRGPGGVLPRREDQIPNDLLVEAQPVEPERVSLDSFASNELSDDGYPRVDLDTIDSGFGECVVVPGAADSNAAEQLQSDSFRDHKSLSSNYVKQWMARGSIQEDLGSPGAQTP